MRVPLSDHQEEGLRSIEDRNGDFHNRNECNFKQDDRVTQGKRLL
jgi:hypothetical protein